MMYWGYNQLGWWGVFQGLFMFLFWTILILFFILLIRKLSAGGSGGNKAFDILRERYAKGEIGKEEFEQKKKELL